MRIRYLSLFLIVIMLVFASAAGCAKLPNEEVVVDPTQSVSDGSSGSSGSSSAPTPTYTMAVTLSTPIPTVNVTDSNKPEFSEPPNTPESKPNYMKIYDQSYTFNSDVVAFDYNLEVPPMLITCIFTVPEVTDNKEGHSGFGPKDKFSTTVTLPAEYSWYKVTVYDADTLRVVKEFDIPRFSKSKYTETFKLLGAGKYHIELSGNAVTAQTIVEVPPENSEKNSANQS